MLLPFSRKIFHQAFGPLEVEDLAAAWALEFAAELGITDAVLEGDSLMLIQALEKKKKKKKISRPYLQNEIIIPKLKNTLYQHIGK